MFKKIALIILLVVALTTGYFLFNYYKNGQTVKDSAITGAIPAIIPINQSAVVKEAKDETNLGLTIPKGYKISIFADNLGGPRDLEFDPNGVVLASIPSKGEVVAIKDGKKTVVATGLNKPHGLAFRDGKLFIADTGAVNVFDYDAGALKASNKEK